MTPPPPAALARRLSQGLIASPDPATALGDWVCADDVAVCVPDATRPVDPRPALQALAPRLPHMRVVIGLGVHRRMTPDELAPLLPWSPTQSDPDDVLPTATVMGIPGAVTRAVGQADWSLGVGIAELHQYAGVSGGHKAVSVGCGGREAIGALHHRDRVVAPGVRIGQVDGNPFRQAVDALGAAARCRLALVWVPQRRLWVAGDPQAVTREAARLIDPWRPVRRTWPGAVMRVPPVKGVSLYQASRAATYLALSPAPPIVEGGTLVVDAPCPEGLGAEAGFVAALRSCPAPWTELLTGPPPTGAGAQRAVILALVARRFRLRVTSCVTADALRAVGVDATAEPAPQGPDWLVVHTPFTRLPQRQP